MIQLDKISVVYGKSFHAVDDVSLQVKRGEVFGVVGASGAGKSTLLRAINLLERPSSGRVVFEGEDITGHRGEALRRARLKLGMVFQHFNLLRNKTVFQNVAMALRIAKTPKAATAARVAELLALVGLSDKRDSYPGQLSGGQKQRVGVARALANQPRALLCDEPTSALDLESTKAILDLLRDINRRFGITIVLISHEMDVVKSVCDRVAVMAQGKVVELGDVYDIFAAPEHEVTRELVRHTQNMDLPGTLRYRSGDRLVKVFFRGEKAVEPVFSDTAQLFGVSLNILHGRIEYIGGRPSGAFIVAVTGEAEQVDKAVRHLSECASRTEEVDYAI